MCPYVQMTIDPPVQKGKCRTCPLPSASTYLRFVLFLSLELLLAFFLWLHASGSSQFRQVIKVPNLFTIAVNKLPSVLIPYMPDTCGIYLSIDQKYPI
jgi:hypothetical protein